MNVFSNYPKELAFVVLEYIEYEDQIEFLGCCVDWYNIWLRKYFRKVCISKWKKNCIENILSLLDNFYEQLEFRIRDDTMMTNLMPLASASQFSFQLNCNESQFLQIISWTDRLRAKRLRIEFEDNKNDASHTDFVNSFRKVLDCEELWLNFPEKNSSISLPRLSNLNSLTLRRANLKLSNHLILSSSGNTLNSLTLDNCAILDVSMLGLIPHLELRYCEELTDISSLNNNDHIIVMACSQILDYSHSFRNSRKIEIYIHNSNDEPCIFDFERWKEVESLKLEAFHTLTIHNPMLPKTVKKCCLRGSFVDAVDFTVTTDHILRDLTLSNDNSIRSLRNYGLERLTRIECSRLISLQSLSGLGRGRNQMITISNCPQITNFSELSQLPVVHIIGCAGFHDLSQLSFVRNVRLHLHSSVTFTTDMIIDRNPYEYLQSLIVSGINNGKCLNGLVKIPSLGLNLGDLVWIRKFFMEGGRFENQRIVMKDGGIKPSTIGRIIDLHKQFMIDRYDGYNRLPRMWIWTRKPVT